jgi:hypothetical protein
MSWKFVALAPSASRTPRPASSAANDGMAAAHADANRRAPASTGIGRVAALVDVDGLESEPEAVARAQLAAAYLPPVDGGAVG